jgi:NAD(P)H-quinone oxidoreductase subunit 5
LLAPILLILAAGFAFTRPGLRPGAPVAAAEAAALGSLAIAVLGGIVLAMNGAGSSELGWLSTRLDLVSLTMLVLVAFVGWVVLRYAGRALDGDPRQGAFTGWMALTLAAVLVFVQAGHVAGLVLAFLATSLGLNKLLLHFADRPGAQRAATKRAVTARLAELSLLIAALLLAQGYGTGRIDEILAIAGLGQAPAQALWAAGFLALAAILASAQLPVHGWITEVMEAPTPVSALLHAGVINAGGFLLIRFADVMLLAPGLLAVLALVGGMTALFAGLVMLTQPAVKVALAWSTIGQMGFMILQCGLALFPLALLHIVAHSLYKAHAFLTAASAVETVTADRKPGPIAVPSGKAVLSAFAIALGLYTALTLATAFADKTPQAIALGAVLIFGVAYLIAQGMAGAAPVALARRIAIAATGASVAYVALQSAATLAFASTLPATPVPGPLEWAVLVLVVASFGAVALAQALLPHWAHHPATQGLRIHLANGLYLNTLTDRALGLWKTKPATRA